MVAKYVSTVYQKIPNKEQKYTGGIGLHYECQIRKDMARKIIKYEY